MGEHATYHGDTVKIGTCEDYYYLRADQRHEIDGYEFGPSLLEHARFRFPFPDEDDIEPGHFDDYRRGVKVPGYKLPASLNGGEHHRIQFTSRAGYNLCIDCPESVEDAPQGFGPVTVQSIAVHRNGWNGGPVVSQQALRGGRWVTLLRCGACDGIHRLDTIHDAEPVMEAFLAEAERTEYNPTREDYVNGWGYANSDRQRRFLLDMAARIGAGYGVTV